MTENARRGVKGFVSIPLHERLLKKIQKTNGCWTWKAATTGGSNAYGTIYLNGRNRLAHRVMYELHFGEIPDSKEIDHLCRNKMCVNPDHLEPVTHRENMLRANVGAQNASKTHCPHGHEYTPENTRVKNGSRNCKACESAYRKKRKAVAAISKAEAS